MEFSCAKVIALGKLGRGYEKLSPRYKKPADWELLSDLAEQHAVPLIGNGDILTHYEACHTTFCNSVTGVRRELDNPRVCMQDTLK